MNARLALLSLAISLSFVPAWSGTRLRHTYQKMEPVFDSSLDPPKPFEVTIKHTEIFTDPPPMRGETGVVDLKLHEKDDVLRGAVIENVKGAESSIEIVEYNVAPRFFVDYRKLEAKYAPDLAQMMKAAIADARRRAKSIVARAEPLMNKELEAQKDQPAPKIPQPKKLKIDSDVLKAQIEQSKHNEKLRAGELKAALNSAIEQSKQNPDLKIPGAVPLKAPQMPVVASSKLPDLKGPDLPNLKMPSSNLSSDLKIPETDVKAPPVMPNNPPEAFHAIPNNISPKRVNIPSPKKDVHGNLALQDIEGALKAARDRANTAVKGALPAVNAILTYARGIPAIANKDDANTSVELDAKSVIEWDKWHRQFTMLARGPILRAVNGAGCPTGDDTVKITVYQNHHIDVEISKGSNAAFDNAISSAYRSLDGNASLAFPAGSRRVSVSFLVDNKHFGDGKASSVKSQSAVGDKEVIRLK